MRAAGLALALAACSIPGKHFDNGVTDAPAGTADAAAVDSRAPDAMPTPDAGAAFACLGQPLPTTAPGTLSFSAKTYDVLGGAVVTGVQVQFIFGSLDPIGGTTDASGNVGPVSQTTGAKPLVGYAEANLVGYATVLDYPAVPYVADTSLEIPMLTPAEMSEVANITSDTIDNTKAQLLVAVTDCNGSAITGAMIITSPAGTIRYIAAGLPSKTATTTDSSGSAIIYNVTAGSVTLSAIASGDNLRSHSFTAGAGDLNVAAIQP